MLVCSDLLSLLLITSFLYSSMYKTINSTNLYERRSSNLAASEETLNSCVVIPAFLTLTNLTAASSKEKMQNLAFKCTTCKSTSLQMGDFSSYGNNGWGMWFGRSQTTPLITTITYTHQQVSEVTQLATPSPFGFLRGESHTKEQGQGTNIYMQQGKTVLLYMSWFIAKSQSDKESLGSDSALAGTPVTPRSWNGSWGRRSLTSRALKTRPFLELYYHLPAAGSCPKGELEEEPKPSSAASAPNQLN